MSSNFLTIKERVKDEIRERYYTFGIVLVWQEKFIEEDYGSESLINSVFEDLVRSEKLEVDALVKCADGHDIWKGPVSELPENIKPCPYCEDYDQGDGETFLEFKIADWWRNYLDTKAKKKTIAA